MSYTEIPVPQEWADICPYSDDVFSERMSSLVKEPGFKHAVEFVMPGIDFQQFCQGLLAITNKHDFQYNIMYPFLVALEGKTTSGVTAGGLDRVDAQTPYVFITNHRDIVLDASFLNVSLIRHSKPTTEIAIGSNLLIYDWIETLVRLNKSFIVKRDIGRREALEAARHLSGYIHFAITQKHRSVWIAQREGRAKDSNDRTQESLVKMLALGGDSDTLTSLQSINLHPVAISYELDPNDYLKAKEFLLRSKDPNFKKSQRDDLLSMETGILQSKGRVHFEFAGCINDQLSNIPQGLERAEVAREACHIIDKAIHRSYHIYPCNYISYDLLNDTSRFAERYTALEKQHFIDYISQQLAKVDIPVSDADKAYMRNMMLVMYSNPLTNRIAALD